MGFLSLVPADQLAAVYQGQTLTLFAKGSVVTGVYGFQFRREQLFGGLLFALGGWYPMDPEPNPPTEAATDGPTTSIGTEPYEYQ